MARMVSVQALFLGAAITLGSGAAEAADDLDRLVADSPFRRSSVGEVRESVGSIELRSVVVDGARTIFSVYDQTTKSSQWVSLMEPGLSFIVQSYDPRYEIAVVEHNGRSVAVALKKTKMSIGQGVAQVAPPSAASALPSNADLYAGVDVARSRKAIADEIARRRALRAPGGQRVVSSPPGN